jgi:cytoskeletal protein CcmA (bactofilin family)
MPINLENQFIADTYKSLIHIGDISLNSGTPDALIYTGDGSSSSLTISTPQNGIKVNGPASISGNLNAKNTTLDGTLTCGSTTINGNSNINGNVLITGTLNSSSHTVNGSSNISGNATITGTLSSASHTVRGSTTITGTLNSSSHTVNGSSNISGNATITGTLSSASHTVRGNSNISGNATINGSLLSNSATITTKLNASTIYATEYQNLPTGLTVETSAKQLFPVGSVYITFTANPPNAYPAFAGTTWEATAQGSFVLGVGSRTDNNPDPKKRITRSFPSAGAVAGEWEHQLTIDEMPRHSHGGVMRWPNVGGQQTEQNQEGRPENNCSVNTSTLPQGGDAFHNNTPPGFALYIWRRTA